MPSRKGKRRYIISDTDDEYQLNAHECNEEAHVKNAEEWVRTKYTDKWAIKAELVYLDANETRIQQKAEERYLKSLMNRKLKEVDSVEVKKAAKQELLRDQEFLSRMKSQMTKKLLEDENILTDVLNQEMISKILKRKPSVQKTFFAAMTLQ